MTVVTIAIALAGVIIGVAAAVDSREATRIARESADIAMATQLDESTRQSDTTLFASRRFLDLACASETAGPRIANQVIIAVGRYDQIAYLELTGRLGRRSDVRERYGERMLLAWWLGDRVLFGAREQFPMLARFRAEALDTPAERRRSDEAFRRRSCP